MALKHNLINQKFGKLLVLEETTKRKNKSPVWKCKCDCGNICEYATKELLHQNRKECDQCAGKDITGLRFGKLVALYPTEERKNNAVVWMCQCDCGKTYKATLKNLKAGHVKSCGCLSRKEISAKNIIDLTGQVFGKLTVIEITDMRKNKSVVWKCRCSCGNQNFIYVDSHSLRRGNTLSCGCLKSKGELKLLQILNQLNISYEYQKTFSDCKIIDKKLSFDFYLPDYKTILEYDGKQHFEPIQGFGGEARYKEQQKRDNFKNDWCAINNIKIIRIPYTDYDKLDEKYILNLLK